MGEFTPTALLALLSLIPLTAYVVWTKRPQVAALAVVFFATLFGPEGAYFKLPAIPPLDKQSLAYAILFGVAVVRWRGTLRRGRLGRGVDLLVFVAVVAGFVTWRMNTEPLRYGSWRFTDVEALRFNDGLQYGLVAILTCGLPFVLGRSLFRTRRDLLDLFRFLVVAGLVQVPFLLVEIRFSPQWHSWIYGYSAHPDFLQTMRWGGYRPMVFMAHGLALSLFMCVVLFSTLILAKLDEKAFRWPAKRVAIGMFVVVLLCKSTGSILYAAAFGALLAFASHKAQARVVLLVAAIVALYPALRAFDLFPAEWLVERAQAAFGEDRAQSLEFRFDNEAMLLEKAREKLWFGWGGFGRSSVYDPEHGQELTVADGHWIIVLGLHGVVGMITRFGPLLIPLWLLYRRLSRLKTARDRTMVVGLGVICAVLSLDLVPNGLFATYPYFLAGALSGVLQELVRKGSSWSTPPERSSPRRPRRARFVGSPAPTP